MSRASLVLAADVSAISGLSTAGNRVLLHKTLLADLVDCPTLGATAKEPQTNPLLDNFEGMALTGHPRHDSVGVTLISDDNFSATQTTRVLNLAVQLPTGGRGRRYWLRSVAHPFEDDSV